MIARIFRYTLLSAALLALTTAPATAQDASAKPPTFDSCMQAETPATMSQIYTACMASANASDLKRYIIDAEYKAKVAASNGRTQKIGAEAATKRDPNYYYGALATARQSELLLKQEQAQDQTERSAKLCWHATKASRLFGHYRGTLRAHSFGIRKEKAKALRVSCEALPRQAFDASQHVPDSGDLMVDIPEYKSCLSTVTADNIFDIYYACQLADSKNNMLAFRKAGSVAGPMFGGTPLAKVYIATAKIKYRQAELANVLEPKDMEYLCDLVDLSIYSYGQSGETPLAGSADEAMLKQTKQMQAGCKQRNF